MTDNVTIKPNDMQVDGFDRGIIPAETAARKKREGAIYKTLPKDSGDSDTRSGYTVDTEGLLNNYAIEPDMYIEEESDSSALKVKAARQDKKDRDAAQGLAQSKFGFTEYAETLNGRLAMLGFTIAVVAELLTGQGILSQLGIMGFV
ncbi:MAG: chlorophyll a/b-binding protein [Cyanobacteria bacterium P01_F01_bin.86]